MRVIEQAAKAAAEAFFAANGWKYTECGNERAGWIAAVEAALKVLVVAESPPPLPDDLWNGMVPLGDEVDLLLILPERRRSFVLKPADDVQPDAVIVQPPAE